MFCARGTLSLCQSVPKPFRSGRQHATCENVNPSPRVCSVTALHQHRHRPVQEVGLLARWIDAGARGKASVDAQDVLGAAIYRLSALNPPILCFSVLNFHSSSNKD